MLHPVTQLRSLFKPAFPYRFVQFPLQFPPRQTNSGTACLLHADPRRAFIQQIDGLIRQIQIRKVPNREPHRFFQCILRNPQMVMPFKPRLQSS